MKKYVIGSKSEVDASGKPLYWSNSQGWVDIALADEFTEQEKSSFTLPSIGLGKWVELKDFSVTFMLTIYKTYSVDASTKDEAKANAELRHSTADEFEFDLNDLANDWKEKAKICGITEYNRG